MIPANGSTAGSVRAAVRLEELLSQSVPCAGPPGIALCTRTIVAAGSTANRTPAAPAARGVLRDRPTGPTAPAPG
ncbi:hypothetical protein [Streptomyces spiralis]|uniref:hypothetical protein n=1 Tax=Streptomyces spiralis TaxID=66376 RepID=UPI0033C900E4